jgi:hypothetical protein
MGRIFAFLRGQVRRNQRKFLIALQRKQVTKQKAKNMSCSLLTISSPHLSRLSEPVFTKLQCYNVERRKKKTPFCFIFQSWDIILFLHFCSLLSLPVSIETTTSKQFSSLSPACAQITPNRVKTSSGLRKKVGDSFPSHLCCVWIAVMVHTCSGH